MPARIDAADPHKLVFLVSTLNRHNAVKDLIQSMNTLKIPERVSARVVITDNSDDNNLRGLGETLECALPVIWAHEPRTGLSRARNRCMAFVEPEETACFIDDDIILPAGFLEDVVAVLDAHRAYDIIGGRVELYDTDDQPITIKTSKTMRTLPAQKLPFGFIHGCCMLIRGDVFETLGPFDEALGPGTPVNSAEDTDYLIRAVKRGFGVLYCPDFFVYHNHGRKETGTAVKLQLGYWEGEGAIYAKYFLRFDFSLLRPFYWQIRRDFQGSRIIDMYGRQVPVTLKYRRILRGVWLYILAKVSFSRSKH